MTALPPSPFLESSTATGGLQEALAHADRNTSVAGLLLSPALRASLFDHEPPLRDEPLPLFLTDAAPEMDRELEAMLRVHFGF